ncbi:MAG: D-alanyl-D-alanine carboxypeptidase/D-alanyl-D-alanine-endopeptidase [Planctomycetes bacterium]|nr:D-alanyl-D-alanine carboxypeptidase/D-alanyl-D-alanine-endopeptidase [Planctomycetota bacterium]
MTLLRFVLCTLLATASTAFGDLQVEVEKIVNSSDLNSGTVGICILDLATGKSLVQINATKRMTPASNQKLLTTGAALHVLGPSFEFKTRLFLDDQNLTIVGDGDPTIGDVALQNISDWADENNILDTELNLWVDAVKSSGLEKIETLFLDDRIFDQNYVHPTWPADQINNWYCAQVSGLNYHLNVVHFYPSPRSGRTAALGHIAPRMEWVSVGNRTTSKTGKGTASSFWVARLPNTNKMTARGNVNAEHKVPVKVAFHDPAIVLGNTFANALRRNGIAVGKVKHVDSKSGKAPGKLLYTHSTPIQTALNRSNTDSHNLYAETLLKRLAAQTTGRSGTFDEGGNVVEAVLVQRLNVALSQVHVADGSGMSRKNQISPRVLALWLASFDLEDSAGKSLVQSLATPGSGTLKNRFKGIDLQGGTVHAKSGYLRGICALSGYITFENRLPLVFSILVNNVQGTVKGAKKMQERIVTAAVAHAIN